MRTTVSKVNPDYKRVRFSKEFKLQAVRLLTILASAAAALGRQVRFELCAA